MLIAQLARTRPLTIAASKRTASRFRVLAVVRAYSTPTDLDVPKKSKIWGSAEEAIKDVQSGQVLMVGGFGLAGVPGEFSYFAE